MEVFSNVEVIQTCLHDAASFALYDMIVQLTTGCHARQSRLILRNPVIIDMELIKPIIHGSLNEKILYSTFQSCVKSKAFCYFLKQMVSGD